ncbi:MAG: hypothetical protein HYW49_13065 [Deltaproteobacteria bacterium]|nr:hypothetical protein [Deltaproteobacteria bacterium]
MVSLRKTLTTAHNALESAGIAHALIGGFALAHFGVHRATQDVDFIADGGRKAEIIAALTQAGFQLTHDLAEALHFEGVGNLDILLARRPISKSMLSQAKKMGAEEIKILGVEDIIGLKIQAYKNNPKRLLQDQADIQALIEHNPSLDWTKVKHYADQFSEWPTIEKLKQLIAKKS